jgi:hypothetical protein
MSELTRCNFCNLRDIKARAKKRGMKVTLIRDDSFKPGGKNIYVHPPSVNVRKLEDEPRKEYCVGWMWEIGRSCSC